MPRGRPRTKMRYRKLVAGSYRTETLGGTGLQLLKTGGAWSVFSSTRREGPFPTMKGAKILAEAWDSLVFVKGLGRGFKVDNDAPIVGRYRLSLTTADGELIDVYDLGGSTGYPLPLGKLGPESLAGEITDVLRGYEKNHPPEEEVPI